RLFQILKHFMKEEQVMRQDEDLLETLFRAEDSPMDHGGDVVNVIVRKARYWIINNDEPLTPELTALFIKLAVTDLEKVEEGDESFLTLTECLEDAGLLS